MTKCLSPAFCFIAYSHAATFEVDVTDADFNHVKAMTADGTLMFAAASRKVIL